ncbi:NfeD family protein [Breoghania sp.]|uniref:NfeD family protein n=1 Tax=Breoghania sp. TaxID=2065378 RepID=UPI0037494C88
MSLFATIIGHLGPWSWHILGLLLLGLEILAPGTFFLWFGVSALIVGTLAIFVDLSWQVEVVIFVVIAFACLFAGRRYILRNLRGSDREGEPGLNRRGSRYVGREFVLDEPIKQASGRLRIDDTVWRITGPDLPEGTRVRVVEVDGTVLRVTTADE